MDTRKAAKPGPPTKPVPPAVSPPRGGERRLVLRRMGRVLRFDKAVYPDAARDTGGVRQAGWVVCVVTLAVAVGAVLVAGWHLGVLLAAVLAAVLHWLIWAGVTYLI